MRVPLAASMATGRGDAFEQALQDAVAADEAAADTDSAPRHDDGPAAPTDAAPADDASRDALRAEPHDDAAALASEQPSAADPNAGHLVTHGAAGADVTDSIRRGEPVRQATAGKGADSSRTSSPTVEPLLAAAVGQRGQAAPGNGFTLAPSAPAAPAATAARTGTGPTAAIAAAEPTPAAPARAAATTASYRTSGAASAELIEHARDSVFKQILVQLTGDGGEMRLRLEPPDLGELDLRLVVEQGNRLSLTIAAERQDLADLLHRHLDELKHTLQQAGLEIGGATVQTRSEFAREQRERDAAAHAGGSGAHDDRDDDSPPVAMPRRGIRAGATGLDFWA